MRKSIQLKEERMRIVTQYRAMVDKKYAEKRDYTADETTLLAKMDVDLDKLDKEILMNERLEAREAEAARDPRAGAGQPAADLNANPSQPTSIRGTADYHKTFTSFLKHGPVALSSTTPEIRAALQQDNDAAGGYVVASEQFSSMFIQKVNDQVFIRSLATKETVATAISLGIPTLAADPADADWTSEIATGSEDSTMAFGKRELYPHPLAKRIKVSNKLLRNSPNVDNKVLERLAYKFGITEEKGFLTGSGAQQPLGVFTATADGISTGRDVVTGSTTAILADSLFDAFYSLKAQYQQRATWGFHRDGVKQIRKLKDSQNRYLWEPAITAGQPSLILSRPFFMSEYVPNTFTTGLYVGIVGDFSQYVVADALSMTVQRLVELYAENNQTGFIARQEVDGMPVLEEAFARLKTS